MSTTTIVISAERSKAEFEPITRKGIVMFRNNDFYTNKFSSELVAEETISRISLFRSAYKRAVNAAFRKARRKGTKYIEMSVLAEEYSSPPDTLYYSPLDADWVKVSLKFYN